MALPRIKSRNPVLSWSSRTPRLSRLENKKTAPTFYVRISSSSPARRAAKMFLLAIMNSLMNGCDIRKNSAEGPTRVGLGRKEILKIQCKASRSDRHRTEQSQWLRRVVSRSGNLKSIPAVGSYKDRRFRIRCVDVAERSCKCCEGTNLSCCSDEGSAFSVV